MEHGPGVGLTPEEPMPLTKRFRIFDVEIDDKFTRHLAIPEHEIPIVKAGWRGHLIKQTPTIDVVEIVCDPATAYQSLLNRYATAAVKAIYPGPERLEI